MFIFVKHYTHKSSNKQIITSMPPIMNAVNRSEVLKWFLFHTNICIIIIIMGEFTRADLKKDSNFSRHDNQRQVGKWVKVDLFWKVNGNNHALEIIPEKNKDD